EDPSVASDVEKDEVSGEPRHDTRAPFRVGRVEHRLAFEARALPDRGPDLPGRLEPVHLDVGAPGHDWAHRAVSAPQIQDVPILEGEESPRGDLRIVEQLELVVPDDVPDRIFEAESVSHSVGDREIFSLGIPVREAHVLEDLTGSAASEWRPREGAREKQR